MTVLNCSATTCIYNENSLCSRGEIEVRGDQAHRSAETCCSSFRDRNSQAAKNMAEKKHCGCERIQIDCKAQECTYNEHCKCTAAAIDIDGPNANKYEDTQCGTFICKH